MNETAFERRADSLVKELNISKEIENLTVVLIFDNDELVQVMFTLTKSRDPKKSERPQSDKSSTKQ